MNNDNYTELIENWVEIKEKLKYKFEMLSESELLFTEGKQEEMLDRLQTKLGKTKAEIIKIIAELQAPQKLIVDAAVTPGN